MTTVTLANRGNATFEVTGRRPLLDELRDLGVDLPFGCRYGGCITCAAKLIDGEIDQRPLHPLVSHAPVPPLDPGTLEEPRNVNDMAQWR